MPAQRVRVTATVRGTVQGVGFRDWVGRQARGLGLDATATNRDDGTVEVVVVATPERCAELVAVLRSGASPGRVESVTQSSQPLAP